MTPGELRDLACWHRCDAYTNGCAKTRQKTAELLDALAELVEACNRKGHKGRKPVNGCAMCAALAKVEAI